MNEVFLLIGGNLGDRSGNLAAARALIGERIGTIGKTSAIYETAAWGLTNQPDFYNQAVQVFTSLDPERLMQVILAIEAALGRIRKERYGPRLIDIDILLFNNSSYHSAAVTIPHPRMQERRFVLAPLQEIAPEYRHPQLGQTIQQLLAAVTDDASVKKL